MLISLWPGDEGRKGYYIARLNAEIWWTKEHDNLTSRFECIGAEFRSELQWGYWNRDVLGNQMEYLES